jgi:hypothetical protein
VHDQRLAASGESLQLGRFVVAAEWVGVLSGHGPGTDDLRFAPGGVAHAFDRSTGAVVCGADAAELEVFWIDFLRDDWAYRCEACVRRTSEVELGRGRSPVALRPARRHT